ncbi:MAG: sporulation transcriptional regulator SpoIIID [Erysipelotrichaceae bacterium]|nr:sporulation transcriptional regulator SpoIIID [Erysipelotrichaceae bacterium]
MDKKIVSRVLEEGKYIIDTEKTVREMALIFGISKSTIHKDLRERLLEIDVDMYRKVSRILQYHMDIRHIRGGESTRRKFLEKNAN